MKTEIAIAITLFAAWCLPVSYAATAPVPAPAKAAAHSKSALKKAASVPAPAPMPEIPALIPVPARQSPVVSTEMRFVSVGHITFETNKWDIGDASKQILDQAATYLAVNRGAARLLIRGHTDEVGGLRFNDELSKKRAAAVRDYLLHKGIDVQWVRWEAHGERAPIDENWNPLGRARNRQVELFAIYPPLMAPR